MHVGGKTERDFHGMPEARKRSITRTLLAVTVSWVRRAVEELVLISVFLETFM